MLPLARLLQLVPRLIADLQGTVIKLKPALALEFFSNSEEGTTIVDTSNPAITVILKGKEIVGMIIDGGSRVNVISRQTCEILGIQE